MSGAVSPQVVERWILESANPHNPQSQLQATHDLQQFLSSTSDSQQHPDARVATLLLSLLTSSNHETVVFCALSELTRLDQKDPGLSAPERTQLLHLLLSNNSASLTRFYSLRNKSSLLLATWILQGKWENFQAELTALASHNPILFLRTLETMLDLMVTVSTDEAPGTNIVAPVDLDAVRRMRALLKAGASEQFCEKILGLLSNSATSSPDLAVAALKTIKGVFVIDLPSLSIPTVNRLLECFLMSLQPHREAALQLAALEAWGEWIHSTAAVHPTAPSMGAANDNKSGLLADDRHLKILGALLEKVHEYNLLPVSGESNAEIEVVIEIAKLVCSAGLHLLPTWSDQPDTNAALQARFNQILDLFFRAFAYDDIDVSSAVIPVAAGLVKTVDRIDARLLRHMPQLLNIRYNQLKYPPDYNQQNDDDAEEQVYRTELCKLYTKMVRDHSAMCLQFMCEASNQWLTNNGSKPAKQDVEATLRLIFQYSEGLLPSPGIKTAMKDATFCSLFVALHTSDLVSRFADDSNILCLFYEVSVRYSAIFLNAPNTPLLSPLLEALSGAHGLQHSDGRLRSRCCFLLLRLVTSLSTLLRPYVEPAVSGIQNLLAQSQSRPDLLRDEDSMYLFETMGILVGKTGVDEGLQVQYLSTMLTSHVKAMDHAIQRPDLQQDVHHHGENLASSISAMAHLSKGFSKQPSAGVKTVLVETMSATARVLESLPSSEAVRNKSMVLFQRMILCLGPEVLQFFPRVLFPLIAHCTVDDILFVSQLFNQLCIKFKQNAVPAIDGSLLSFLQKCHSVIPLVDADLASGLPPHLRTEQWSIQKLAYAVLLAIVSNQATSVLLSTRNVSGLETILRTMSDGAVHVRDGVIQRTCIRFFRELVDQWGANPAPSPTSSAGNNDAVVYQRGFMTFTIQVFLGGMLETLLDPVFNPLDANQARCMTELSHVIYGCLHYDQSGTLTALAPLRASSEFRLANSVEQVDQLLRQLVSVLRRDTRS